MTAASIKQLVTMDDLEAMQHVESAVWNMEVIPIHQTFTAMKNGGLLLGAYDDSHMIGFLYSFPGFAGGIPYLCSHMMGLLPDYQKQGIGARLKLKQAEIAREMGYRMITWTYDPLESKNAYLNLHKLGAVGAWFKPNHYGVMHDALNHGLPTDRIQIRWVLDEPSVSKKGFPNENNNDTAKDPAKDITLAIENNPEKVLLQPDDVGMPVRHAQFQAEDVLEGDVYFMAIPKHFQVIKQTHFAQAKAWRLETGHVLQTLFDQGFEATDVLSHDDSYCYYVLTKNNPRSERP